MNYLLLWIYILFLAFIWGVFIIAKIHAYKFKNFSHNIEKVTTALFIFILSLSIIWFILIFYMDLENYKIELNSESESYSEEYY